MPAKIFGGRVNFNINSHFNAPLPKGVTIAVIYNGNYTALFRQLYYGFNILQLEGEAIGAL